ncbi:MAG: acyl-CoA reductase [Bacteroidetes bacterium 4572_77]|nr:MAG: acyl-CoA reductase [Bacteroidetes bacterium 4572_77]
MTATTKEKIQAFAKLGSYLKALIANNMKAVSPLEIQVDQKENFAKLQDDLLNFYAHSTHHNAWFTADNVLFSLKEWSIALQEESLNNWLKNYDFPPQQKDKTIGIVMAGNLPLVGFHDYLCVIMSNYTLLAKLSSDDAFLLPVLHEMISIFEPKLQSKAHFTKDQLKGFDAIIATGSDNTARYFEYYFSKYPHIIRKNRSGVAVLSGEETTQELKALADDMLTYFGLGCRSVSKLYVPKNYEFKKFFQLLEDYSPLAHHSKFFNNYEYNKAIYLVNKNSHRDTGFLLFTENTAMSSPIAVVYYEEYEDTNLLHKQLNMRSEEIQCIVGPSFLNFGETQHPKLHDYADGIDTMDFLLKL